MANERNELLCLPLRVANTRVSYRATVSGPGHAPERLVNPDHAEWRQVPAVSLLDLSARLILTVTRAKMIRPVRYVLDLSVWEREECADRHLTDHLLDRDTIDVYLSACVNLTFMH